jgi:hypothetical protein
MCGLPLKPDIAEHGWNVLPDLRRCSKKRTVIEIDLVFLAIATLPFIPS